MISIIVHVSGLLSDCALENLFVLCSVFYVNTARDVVTGLLIFAKYSFFTCTFSHAHTEAHTHKHTCIIRTQEEW